jgi:hypothetical protein
MIELLGFLALVVLGALLVAAAAVGAGLFVRWLDRHR